MSNQNDLRALSEALKKFAEARDWDQFHTPKNLAMALSKECAELMEPFQWLTPEQSSTLDTKQRERVAEEIGDVLIYLVRLSSQMDLDPLDCAWRKLSANEVKYPASKVRGSAAKYTEY